MSDSRPPNTKVLQCVPHTKDANNDEDDLELSIEYELEEILDGQKDIVVHKFTRTHIYTRN